MIRAAFLKMWFCMEGINFHQFINFGLP